MVIKRESARCLGRPRLDGPSASSRLRESFARSCTNLYAFFVSLPAHSKLMAALAASQRPPPPTPKASLGFRNAFEDSPGPGADGFSSSARGRRSEIVPPLNSTPRLKKSMITPDRLGGARRGDGKGKARMLVEETVEEEGEDDSMMVDEESRIGDGWGVGDESRVEVDDVEVMGSKEERDWRGEVCPLPRCFLMVTNSRLCRSSLPSSLTRPSSISTRNQRPHQHFSLNARPPSPSRAPSPALA